MGFFSFKTTDTNKAIKIGSDTLVFMLDNKGNIWTQNGGYRGFGLFGGKDIYELLAEMNGKETRDEGIDIAYQDDQKGIKWPNLVTDDSIPWKNKKLKTDPSQGW
jgi:hypothetical protein